jgi:hypothetical protein
MDAVEWSVVVGMAVLVLGCLAYAVVRLMNEPRTGLDPKSQRLARAFLYPRFLDPLLARPMSRREKIGWLIVLAVMVAAVAFTLITGIGVRG